MDLSDVSGLYEIVKRGINLCFVYVEPEEFRSLKYVTDLPDWIEAVSFQLEEKKVTVRRFAGIYRRDSYRYLKGKYPSYIPPLLDSMRLVARDIASR